MERCAFFSEKYTFSQLSSDSVGYRALMLQSLTLLFVLTAILYENWFGEKVKNIVAILLITIVFNNSLMANISYFYMNLCYERTYADGLEMIMEVHDLQDEYEFDKIAVLGERLADEQWLTNDLVSGAPVGKIHMLSGLLETNLMTNSEHLVPFLKATFGLELQTVNKTDRNQMLDTDWGRAMNCWPAENSMTVVDDVLIIKLSDQKEGE